MALLAGIGSALTQAKSEIPNGTDPTAGGMEHAIITVYDSREKMAEAPTINTDASKTAGSKSALGKLSPSLPKPLSSSTATSEKRYTVQFNPTTLRFNAHNEPITHGAITGSQKPGTASCSTQAPIVELHVDLVFDMVQNGNAFIGDKFTSLASTQAAKNAAASLYNTALGDNTSFTVKPVVEAFLAALRTQSTRRVCFSWKDFRFEGLLKNANVEYTMFSPAGRPIRAKMGLRIRQAASEASQLFWKKSFDKAFSDNGSLSLSKIF